MNRQQRIEFLSSLPYLTRLDIATQCDGYRWGAMPLKAVWSMHGKPPTGKEQYRCKAKAKWIFRALKRSDAKSGTYCYQHLNHACLLENLEYERLIRYWDKWKAIHGIDS